MNAKNFFYCYSKQLHDYLHKVNKVSYILTALHENTKNKFWLYEKTPELERMLNEYELSKGNR